MPIESRAYRRDFVLPGDVGPTTEIWVSVRSSAGGRKRNRRDIVIVTSAGGREVTGEQGNVGTVMSGDQGKGTPTRKGLR